MCTKTSNTAHRRANCLRFALAAVFLTAACFIGETPASATDNVTFGEWGVMLYGHTDYVPMDQPVWSRNGKWVAFSCMDKAENRIVSTIKIVSPDGGTPQVIFKNYEVRTIDGNTVIFPSVRPLLGGFSPDGKYLYFARALFDESRGSTYVYTPHTGGYGLSIDGFAEVVDRLDLTTGEVTEIADGYTWCRLSHSGEILLLGKGYQPTLAKNLETGETWELPDIYANSCCFTPDDQYVIYTDESQALSSSTDTHDYWTTGQLYKVPVVGGTPVQLTQYTAGEATGRCRVFPDCSPDGNWVAYTDINMTIKAPYDISFTKNDLRRWGSTSQNCINALNLITGEIASVTSFPKAGNLRMGTFNPEGSQFCFWFDDITNQDYEYGVYIKDFNPTKTGDSEITLIADAVPAGFALTGNYPNPFNPTTTISFTLPSSGAATLSIYNVTGQKVRDLVNGPLSAGSHSVTWNGRDASGKAVSSGVYLSRLNMGSHTAVGRMLLAK